MGRTGTASTHSQFDKEDNMDKTILLVLADAVVLILDLQNGRDGELQAGLGRGNRR
jgi:hypothetical protein